VSGICLLIFWWPIGHDWWPQLDARPRIHLWNVGAAQYIVEKELRKIPRISNVLNVNLILFSQTLSQITNQIDSHQLSCDIALIWRLTWRNSKVNVSGNHFCWRWSSTDSGNDWLSPSPVKSCLQKKLTEQFNRDSVKDWQLKVHETLASFHRMHILDCARKSGGTSCLNAMLMRGKQSFFFTFPQKTLQNWLGKNIQVELSNLKSDYLNTYNIYSGIHAVSCSESSLSVVMHLNEWRHSPIC